MSGDLEPVDPETVPDWEDPYFDRVSDRLMFNYDLEKEFSSRGETFDLYGEMRIQSEKHLFSEHLNYARHGSTEHLFARRQPSVSVADLEGLASLGHDLFDEWVEPDERHYSTDFTFVLIVPEIPGDVRSFVEGYKDRNLLRYGYYGHYETNLVVCAPDEEAIVRSVDADVGAAFALWSDVPSEGRSLRVRLLEKLFSGLAP